MILSLFGDYSPSGKLPVSIAFNAGQIPIHYNHLNGSSFSQNTLGYFKDYVDCSHEPRYFFGHGLSYTTFEYENIAIKNKIINPNENIYLEVTISNKGKIDGAETVQIYAKDKFSSMVRPVKELIGFQKVFVQKGDSKTISFEINPSLFAFLDRNMKWKIEKGEILLEIGSSSKDIRFSEEIIITDDLYISGADREFYSSSTIE